ncbi:MAG: polysaccharide deacetylase family protein [Ferruginibacter sp.]|nr:polysaccharide deacetylase family protein [Ferruginibacter sp.]
MFYFIKTPNWLQMFFPAMVWKIKTMHKNIYLTFDDGPHPVHTTFVLDELKKYNAKATFFCIGKNVKDYPNVYTRIINEGHSVGNHTHNHLKGKKTTNKLYIENVSEASKYIDSNLFRPPYGSIKKMQTKLLTGMPNPFKIIMWTVLSGDFDIKLTKEKCLKNVLEKTKSGDIVVFHDSEKAAERMYFALPKMLEHFTDRNYFFKKI